MHHLLYAIRYCSFVDEYDRFFLTSGQNQAERDAIARIDNACRNHLEYFQAVDKDFPELRQARNYLLAHGYRVGYGQRATRIRSIEADRLFRQVANHGSPTTYSILASVPWRAVEEIEKEFGQIESDVLSDLPDEMASDV